MTAANAHTPGPWFLYGYNVYPCTWKCRNNTVRKLAIIAEVSPWDGASQDDREDVMSQARANARLIAQAPALLDALQSIVNAREASCKARISGDAFAQDDAMYQFEDALRSARALLSALSKGTP